MFTAAGKLADTQQRIKLVSNSVSAIAFHSPCTYFPKEMNGPNSRTRSKTNVFTPCIFQNLLLASSDCHAPQQTRVLNAAKIDGKETLKMVTSPPPRGQGYSLSFISDAYEALFYKSVFLLPVKMAEKTRLFKM